MTSSLDFRSSLRNVKTRLVGATKPIHRFVGRMRPAPIVDSFMFYNELDLLELRFRTLYDHVSQFVLAECPLTSSGAPKPLFFQENRERFAPFLDKIVHRITPPPGPGDFHVGMSGSTPSSEAYQRGSMGSGIQHLADDVITLFSDLDEIPDPECFPVLRGALACGQPFATLSQHWHLLYLNARVTKFREEEPGGGAFKWLGTMACTRKKLRSVFNDNPNTLWGTKWGGAKGVHRVKGGGWHFSYLGGPERVLQKIKATSLPSLLASDAADLQAQQFLGATFEFTHIDASYPLDVRSRPEAYAAYCTDQQSYQRMIRPLVQKITAPAGDSSNPSVP